MILELQQRLSTAVRAAVRAAYDADVPAVNFEYPPRLELGDLALTVPFDLAKVVRRPPREIAQRLAAELAAAPGIRRVEVAGAGYLNLFLSRGPVARELREHLRQPAAPPAVPGRVIVEHTSINPNKAAHIGHLRNATLGDTFVNVLRHRGHDVGHPELHRRHRACRSRTWSSGFLYLEGKTLAEVERIPGRFDYYCWDLYARVGDFYAAYPANKARQAEVLHAIEQGGNDTARMAAYIAGRIVDCHLATMERLGIRYDLLAHESDILRLHFWDRAFELLKQSGAIRLETEGKNAGCWVLRHGRARLQDEDKIIVRSNGVVTYTGKDIAYQLWKLGLLDRDFRYRRHRTYPDGHVLWSSTSTDGEAGAPGLRPRARRLQRDRRRPVLSPARGQGRRGRAGAPGGGGGQPPPGLREGGPLAGDRPRARLRGLRGRRRGEGLGPQGAGGQGRRPARRAGGQGAGGDRGPRPRAGRRGAASATARDIATGALRYFLLKYGRTKIITFDMEEALAFTGETGPYVQNGVVRARNIFAKLEAEGARRRRGCWRAPARLDLDALLTGEEGDEVWALLMLMARTDEVAEQAVRAEEVALVAKHAFAVAQAFHSYYQKPRYSVLHAESEDLPGVPGRGRGRLRPPDGAPHRPARHPRAGAHVRRPLIGVTAGIAKTDHEVFAAARRLRAGGGDGRRPAGGARARARGPGGRAGRPARRAAAQRRRGPRPRALRRGAPPRPWTA